MLKDERKKKKKRTEKEKNNRNEKTEKGKKTLPSQSLAAATDNSPLTHFHPAMNHSITFLV